MTHEKAQLVYEVKIITEMQKKTIETRWHLHFVRLSKGA